MMVRTTASRLVLAAALASALAACSSETPTDAPTATEEPAVLKERHDNFEAIGDAFKAVRGELEKDAPDFALIAASATDINTRAQKIEGHFPAGTSVDDGYDTEALATIWEKPEEFKAAAQKLVDESAKLATIAGEGDKAATGAQAMAMGGACKGCHDNFRLDDEK
ncbi:c-type cytochrome [Erythrobacter dokdonensis]|uniref:Putative cytochrome c signal peptide protein n=1 Tax=Erythrobacter dokdonensis DSW-74 TaxID=1300349 RepID=A0A1A7BKF4_9SPHN|nr:cytochrome c [Erythrobacter dokdonensis]OBV12206.1 putative cytochrome c signal peptide protein [Erythrobacter dokdonensis DSW-74]